MARKIEIREPSPEVQEKMHNAIRSVRNKKKRKIVCPYCRRGGIYVFVDSIGYIQNKCNVCGTEYMVDLVNMRRGRKIGGSK